MSPGERNEVEQVAKKVRHKEQDPVSVHYRISLCRELEGKTLCAVKTKIHGRKPGQLVTQFMLHINSNTAIYLAIVCKYILIKILQQF